MHRSKLLMPLLALAMMGACGGKGEQSRGELDERAAAGDERPPVSDQQPSPSGDEPRLSEPAPTTEDDTCETVCDAGRPDCDTSRCVESCHEGFEGAPQCVSEWRPVLRCIVQNDLYCQRDLAANDVFALCGREYLAFSRCMSSRAQGPE